MNFLRKTLLESEFLPHLHCYLVNKTLMFLHVLSDSLIALSYYFISLILLYFLKKRLDLPFRAIFYLFGAFILACGTTHLLEVWTLWYPIYWVSGYTKLFTAFVSALTAFLLIPAMPKALALRSTSELAIINKK